MSYWSGAAFFTAVTVGAGIVTAMISAMLVSAFPGLGALLLSITGVGLLLNVTSYSR